MSDTILHPIIHGRNLGQHEMLARDEQKAKDFEDTAKASVVSLADYLARGYKIVDAFDSQHADYHVRQYVLHKDDESVNSGEKLMVVHLRDCSIQTGFSKTFNTEFDYLKCEFSDNMFVNIFDHPDESRATWKICLDRGWSWTSFQEAIYKGYGIQAVITKDGDFYKLIDVLPEIAHYDYRLHVDTMFKGNEDDPKDVD